MEKLNEVENNYLNKTYKWKNLYINFLDNKKIKVFGIGNYIIVDNYTIKAYFERKKYAIKFNNDFTKFKSLKKNDIDIINGEIIIDESTKKYKFENNKYKFKDLIIKFLDNNKIEYYKLGKYLIVDNYTIKAKYEGQKHAIKFNDDFKKFKSLTKNDKNILNGELIIQNKNNEIYNIIIICELNHLKIRPDKLLYYFFNYLKNNSKYFIILVEPIKKKIDKIINKNSILIVFSNNFDSSNYKNYKIYWIEDLYCICNYGCNGTSNECNFYKNHVSIFNQKYNKIWYKYLTPITKKLSLEKPNYFLKFPHMMFNPDIHKDYELEKKYDILFFGATYKESYPFRNRLYYILKDNIDKFKILFLPYSKKNYKNMITWIDLYKLISSSWLTITCSSISEILVSKYFEIGLCGSVICGDYPSEENEIYIKQNMILLDRDMSDSDIINKISDALSDKSKLKNYSENLKKYISKKYMYKNGIKLFESYIDNSIKFINNSKKIELLFNFLE
jgi:hypothetical protein